MRRWLTPFGTARPSPSSAPPPGRPWQEPGRPAPGGGPRGVLTPLAQLAVSRLERTTPEIQRADREWSGGC